MRRAAILAGVLACAALSGCGGSPGDIMGLGISGGQQRQTVRMHVEENGRASCNSKALHQLSSQQLLDARNIVRDAQPFTKVGAHFGTASSQQRTFELRTPDGTVDWSEAAVGKPPVLSQAELLALQMEQQLC
jgi:hypothetical protein